LGFGLIKFRAIKRLRKYHIHVEFKTKVDLTSRNLAVAEAFGLGIDDEKTFLVVDNDFEVNAGD
jgi:hypothetical protein